MKTGKQLNDELNSLRIASHANVRPFMLNIEVNEEGY